ncbi:MAG: hypothetical protein MZV63_05430 [Marinilabiliales bacterium]|nr:hypothetical protein [Marinilabiliales bacterium]
MTSTEMMLQMYSLVRALTPRHEADLYKEKRLVEAVLTFIEIRQLFDENEIQEKVCQDV